MTQDERELLLQTARAIAELLENDASKFGSTSNHAEEIRSLIEKIAPK